MKNFIMLCGLVFILGCSHTCVSECHCKSKGRDKMCCCSDQCKKVCDCKNCTCKIKK